jgi:hypothetical protein
MTRAALRCAAPALVLAAAVLLPFLGKAFTIDDTVFLRQAEHLLTDPLHPTAFEMVWSSAAAPVRNSAIMPSGPAMAYLLVPCVRLGGTEWVAHLTQLLLFGLAILATAGLALHLGLDPAGARVASLLLAATPAASPWRAPPCPRSRMAFGGRMERLSHGEMAPLATGRFGGAGVRPFCPRPSTSDLVSRDRGARARW